MADRHHHNKGHHNKGHHGLGYLSKFLDPSKPLRGKDLLRAAKAEARIQTAPQVHGYQRLAKELGTREALRGQGPEDPRAKDRPIGGECLRHARQPGAAEPRHPGIAWKPTDRPDRAEGPAGRSGVGSEARPSNSADSQGRAPTRVPPRRPSSRRSSPPRRQPPPTTPRPLRPSPPPRRSAPPSFRATSPHQPFSRAPLSRPGSRTRS
jgi:hypothetical protein